MKESALLQGKTDAGNTSQALVVAISSGIVLGYVACIAFAYVSHIWLLDVHGRPVPFDFLAFWSAGRLVVGGSCLSVFDPHILRATEAALAGHAFNTILPWSYPPLFLFVAFSLAHLPYVPAFVVWIASTLTLQTGVVATIVRQKTAWIVALAPPWILLGILNGQNGFLTASIIGLFLLNLESRPWLAGMLLGLLSYKPQLAILFPVALAFGGYWRAFAWSLMGLVFWTGLSCMAFGTDTLMAFLHGLSGAARATLASGGVAPRNLQSIYGLALWAGLREGYAGAIQACVSIACAVAVGGLWRSDVPFALKAAGIAVAVPLATPYIYVSDLSTLSIAIAFLFRDGPIGARESGAIGIALLCVAIFILNPYPAGVFASPAIAAVVWARYRRAGKANALGLDPWQEMRGETAPSLGSVAHVP